MRGHENQREKQEVSSWEPEDGVKEDRVGTGAQGW